MTRVFAPILALSTLAACGGTGGPSLTVGSGVLSSSGEALARDGGDSMQASVDRGDGVSGVLSTAEIDLSGASVGLSSMRVVLAGDESTARIIIDGSAITLPLLDSGTGYYRYGSESAKLLQLNLGPEVALATYSESGPDSLAGFAYLGIETPTDLLPDGPVSYIGSWGGQGYTADLFSSGVVGGDMTLSVDFTAGTVGGSFDGDVTAGISPLAIAPDISGTITGRTSGNGVTGTMDVTAGGSGSIAFAGNAYGGSGGQIAGGVAGDLSYGGENYAVSGTFLVID